jgi:hypothetical protein
VPHDRSRDEDDERRGLSSEFDRGVALGVKAVRIFDRQCVEEKLAKCIAAVVRNDDHPPRE